MKTSIPGRVATQMSGHKTFSIFDRYHIVADADLQEVARRLEPELDAQTMTMPTILPTKKSVSQEILHTAA